MVVCVFGDSITWGAYDPDGGGWVNRLRNYFEDTKEDIKVYNLGISSDTTTDVLERIDCESKAREPDAIVFAIGINDSRYHESADNPKIDSAQFEKNLVQLIDRARKFSKNIIFIGLTSVDESKTKPIEEKVFYNNKNIRVYSNIIKKVAGENNLPFVDVSGIISNEDLDDGLHPNSSGHEKLFEHIKSSLQKKSIF